MSGPPLGGGTPLNPYQRTAQPPPSTAYPPSTGYAPAPSTGYAPPSTGYAPPSTGYALPPSSGYPPSQQYPQGGVQQHQGPPPFAQQLQPGAPSHSQDHPHGQGGSPSLFPPPPSSQGPLFPPFQQQNSGVIPPTHNGSGPLYGPPGSTGQYPHPSGGPGAPGSFPGHKTSQAPPAPSGRYPAQPGPAATAPVKINPSQVPSPTVQEANKGVPVYHTNSGTLPPSANTQFTAVDQGNSSPKFIRLTTNTIPCSDDLRASSNLPLAVFLQPLAELGKDEEPIPVVDFGESGPIRCQRCRGYINPFVTFVDGGRQFRCQLCNFNNEVPHHYFSPIEANGCRHDLSQRAELCKGTVEFVASKEYMDHPPTPIKYLFVLDVSYAAINSGMLSISISSIKSILQASRIDLTVGFVTFDTSIHFYNLSSSLQQPQMMVVADIEEVFLPIAQEVIFAKYSESSAVIDSLLEKLPTMFQRSSINDSALGAALLVSSMALNNGGKVVAFVATLPSIGPGKLKNRGDQAKYMGTEKEKTLYQAQDSFYEDLGKQCVKAHVSVDFMLFPSGFLDVATIGNVSTRTGGRMYWYPATGGKRDTVKVYRDLQRNLSCTSGYDGLMKLRCSPGLTIVNQYGNFNLGLSGEIELAGIDCDKSFCVELRHDDKIDENSMASLQCALLYTTAAGQRRIRVMNLRLNCTSVLGNVFRSADLNAVLNFFARRGISEVSRKPLQTIRDNLTESCVGCLYVYRKYCATASSGGQLILPETLKLLPVYVLSLIKNIMLRPGSDVLLDERSYLHSFVLGLPLPLTASFFYPRMYALHSMSDECGVPDSRGSVGMPPLVRLSIEFLASDGAYLLENGQRMFLWLGKNLRSTFTVDLFGKEGPVESWNASEIQLSLLETDLSVRVHNILNHIQANQQNFQQPQIIRQNDPVEPQFFSFLVEDKAFDTMSYIDFLCYVHKQIQIQL